MGRKWIWLTLVCMVLLALVVVVGVLRGESRALKTKRGVAPSLLAPSGAGGATAAVSRGSKAAEPTLTVGPAVTPVSMDRDLRDLSAGAGEPDSAP